MDSRCFMFDLVFLNVSVADFDYETDSLTAEVVFNKNEFTVESNPDKVGEFKQGRTCEFSAYPDELKNELMDNPLIIKIKNNQGVVLGEVDVTWPKELLQKLDSNSFLQYSDCGHYDLIANDHCTGKISIQYRLRAKVALSDDEDNEESPRDIKKELEKVVDPNELFFLIQHDSDPEECCGLNDALKKSLQPTALDLSNFKNLHGKVVKDMESFDQVYSLDCCHTKEKYPTGSKSKAQCSNPGHSCSNPGHSCAHQDMTSFPPTPAQGRHYPQPKASSDTEQWACNARQHVKECPHSNKFTSDTTGTESCSCDCENNNTKEGIFDNGKMKNICHYPESPPVLEETRYVRKKSCPICDNDVSWLPKLAACPKCYHKPTPYAVEKPYDENLTAEQILKEWANDDEPKKSACEKTQKKACRCTCKNGKVCAYCRIRKLVRDAVKSKSCRESSAKVTMECPPSQKDDISAANICKAASETESRTYLAQVFSELRDLYNLTTNTKKTGFNSNAKCEKEFNQVKKEKVRPKKSLTVANSKVSKENIDLSQNLSPSVKAQWCKGKAYNYKTVRKYPGNLIGHKTCVSSGKSVPPHMGWLWNIDTNGMRQGWKPGAIRKPIKEIMKYFLKDFPVDSIGVSRYSTNKAVAKVESKELIQQPTLHICKRNGAYYITMRPLKDATALKECADPYVPMKPICFKITKSPMLVHASQMKKQLKKQFTKCTCHKPISSCICRTFLDKKRLEFEVGKLSRRKCIPNLKDTLVLSDTTDSEGELDFGVTPPAGVIKPHLKNRPDLACRETQYNEQDLVPKAPAIPSKYLKAGGVPGGGADGGAGDGARYGGRFGGARGGRGGQSGRGGHNGPGGPGGRGGGAGGGGPGGRGGGARGLLGGQGGGRGGAGRGGPVNRGGVGGGGANGGDPNGPFGAGGAIPKSGGIGGWGGVGGKIDAAGVRGGIGSGPNGKPAPLFNDLARRRKADPCYPCYADPCAPCGPCFTF